MRIDGTHETIVDITNKGRNIVVRARHNDSAVYDVYVDGVQRHPGCTAEATMRALATYLEDGT